jgi:prephenate dehydratase
LPLRIAFQGEPGAFSELAIARWQSDAQPVPYREFCDVTRAVQAGDVDAGVLPIENTTIGPITVAWAALSESGLEVIGVLILPVDHMLLACPGVALADVRTVSSHPAALAQCAGLLARHREWAVVPACDTAGAARDLAASPDPSRAVIASAAAAQRYALSIIQSHVADRSDNATRFVVIRRPDSDVR